MTRDEVGQMIQKAINKAITCTADGNTGAINISQVAYSNGDFTTTNYMVVNCNAVIQLSSTRLGIVARFSSTSTSYQYKVTT